MTPAERTALARFAAVSQDRARRLRLLAEADDALAAHLLRCPEGDDAAALLAWQRQLHGLQWAREDAARLARAASTAVSDAQDAWDRAFAEGA